MTLETTMNLIELTFEPIDTSRLLDAVAHPDAGGEVLFVGTTRRTTTNKQDGTVAITEYLVYEAYESMAIHQIQQLVVLAQKTWPLQGVAVVHRLGKVLPQEASIAIAVSASHRGEAFEAARWLIDKIKLDVPIWKQENFQNETSQWIHPNTCQTRNEQGQVLEVPQTPPLPKGTSQ